MILGLSVATFTLLHVIISLIAIASGLVVLFGMLGARRMRGWMALFLLTTILTSATGFLFPIHGFTPALGSGAVSIVLLAVALAALYGKHLAGAWRWIYVVTASAALYFNVLRDDEMRVDRRPADPAARAKMKAADAGGLLFELGRDAREHGIEFGADRIDDGDDRHCDAGVDQAILDHGRARFVFKELREFRHNVTPAARVWTSLRYAHASGRH